MTMVDFGMANMANMINYSSFFVSSAAVGADGFGSKVNSTTVAMTRRLVKRVGCQLVDGDNYNDDDDDPFLFEFLFLIFETKELVMRTI